VLRLRQALALPLYTAALVVILLSLFGMMLWPAWSEGERRRRLAIVDSLTKDLIIQAFDAVIQRELAEEAEVREEIKQHGKYWAASEIWKLRRQVKALRKQLGEQDERSRT
jgi:hypothetical protein